MAPDEGNSKAWHYLGKCHQEGDKDSQAIAALQRAVETDPSALEAFVDLAVSHTNNMQKDRAMLALEGWLRNNPRYANLAPPPLHEAGRGGEDVEAQLRAMYERQDVLIDCFVEAAQTSPNAVDPAVQVCLGLLYSLALEYDNAAQCFSAALSKLPDDYALWNKLGATLANSGRSGESSFCICPIAGHSHHVRRGGAAGLFSGSRTQAFVCARACQLGHLLHGHEAVSGGCQAVSVGALD